MLIGERISVVASFGPAYGLRPMRFRWGGRVKEIKEITYSWQSRQGESRIYHFSVTDGGMLYELSFDDRTLVWTLTETAEQA